MTALLFFFLCFIIILAVYLLGIYVGSESTRKLYEKEIDEILKKKINDYLKK